jgi:hypothetical protein
VSAQEALRATLKRTVIAASESQVETIERIDLLGCSLTARGLMMRLITSMVTERTTE